MSHFVELTLDVSAVPAKPAGAGRYIYELARQLSVHPLMRLELVARRSDAERWQALPGRSSVQAVVPEQRAQRMLWEQLRMPGFLRSVGSPLHHGPHYTIPERAHSAKVATIHDMTFFDHPEWHERRKVPVFRRAIRKAADRADALVAISNDTARRLQERFGELDVAVIPHGVDHERFCPNDDAVVALEERRRLAELGVHGPYVAFVGTLEPRKDVPSLLQAFDRIADAHPRVSLVLAGRPGWGVTAIDAALGGMKHRDRVVQTGFLPDDGIPMLLRRASAVAYPSLVEGFGLPALEALACGAPLVTTSGSAVEEVVDDGAVVIRPGDVRALAEGLDDLLSDGATAQRLRRRGPEVASRYTWEASAAAHVELYRRLV